MSTTPNETPSQKPLVRWHWIHSARSDLVWYIGSALFGWLYVVLVLWLGRDLGNPMSDPFLALDVGGVTLTLTLGVVVVASWAYLIDAPHVWATLARTFLDPDERRDRSRILVSSLFFFALGPLAVFGPYVVGMVVPLTPGAMAAGSAIFFVCFRIWAYYHVVRQHWGFMVLYKRRNEDWNDPTENLVDAWFFNAALYLPLIVFVTAPWYRTTGMPELGLDVPVLGKYSVASLVHPVALTMFPVTVFAYVWFQVRRYRRGLPRNGPKLALLASIVPLHLAVFLNPLLALFVVPIVTVGHNFQYHRIVWSFGRHKYGTRNEPEFRWARAAFRSVPVYLSLGLLFTFVCYQGPWVGLLKSWIAHALDFWVVPGVGMVAGVVSPESAGIGARVAATFFLGWAMQHYYLDAHIWRVRRDPSIETNVYSP